MPDHEKEALPDHPEVLDLLRDFAFATTDVLSLCLRTILYNLTIFFRILEPQLLGDEQVHELVEPLIPGWL
jgi:hypothetical protein